jgi:TPP-dependent pyruvate/acetoin dehydrogenase alpha subunit
MWLADVDGEIAETLKQAYESPWPDASTLFENVY